MKNRWEKPVKKTSKKDVPSKTSINSTLLNKQSLQYSFLRKPYRHTSRQDRLKKNARINKVKMHSAKVPGQSLRLYWNTSRQDRLKKNARINKIKMHSAKVLGHTRSSKKEAVLLWKKDRAEAMKILKKKAETAEKKAERKYPYKSGYYDEDRERVHTFKKRKKPAPAAKVPDDMSKKLNAVFYKNIDPVYGSFWLGRFINTFQKNGKKRYARREVYQGLSLFKYAKDTNPIIYFFEILDKIKPTLKLRNYLAKRGKIKKYPVPVLPATKIMVAAHWLRQEVRNTQGAFKNGQISTSLSGVLINFKENERKNTLAEKRKQYMRECIMGQFNARFMYRSR